MNLPEGHLHRHPNFYFFGNAIGHDTVKPATAIQIDNAKDVGQIRHHGYFVETEGENRALPIGELYVVDLIFGLALGANSLSRILNGTTDAAFAAGERENLIGVAMNYRQRRLIGRAQIMLPLQQISELKIFAVAFHMDGGIQMLSNTFNSPSFPPFFLNRDVENIHAIAVGCE